MKRTIIVVLLLLIGVGLFGRFGWQRGFTATTNDPLLSTTPTPVSNTPAAIKLRTSTQEGTTDDRALAALIRSLTKRTSAGLVETPHPSGGTQLDIKEGYQDVPLGKVQSDGSIEVVCVENLAGANDFFGRNLETGEVYPVRPRGQDTPAKKHVMTPQELAFFQYLIAEAARQRQLNPNAATLTIINNDGAGEGFNDPAARTPEGGNPGTTLGQQRLNLFGQAAAIWGAFLDSGVSTAVRSNFDPLTCTIGSAVLGSAGPNAFYHDFTGATLTNTWYPIALANKLNGGDLNGTAQEINATFNSSVDNACMGAGTRFYYGYDNNPPAGTVNLLITLLHELGHGLGFLSLVNSSGQFASGIPDVYARFLYDRSVGLYWTQMSDAQRAASLLNTGNVLWDGLNVSIASGFLTAGRETSTGRVQMFTPNPFQIGSSIGHWDVACFPNLLMEPSLSSGVPLDLDLTRQAMRDIGWYRDTTADRVQDTIINVLPNSGSVTIGTTINITWTNTGGFNRNVSIELSTNGGTTYPISIASNVTNSGTRSWTVPNNPTTTARLRVREYDFNEPRGVSSANFTISAGCPTIIVSPTNPTLMGGAVGTFYSQTFTQTGGTGTITWSNPGGGLPGGLSLNTSTGVLSGTPTAGGTFSFTMRATDQNGCTGERQYSLTITQTCPTITVNPTNPTLSPGTMGSFYSQTFTQTGGAGTITWSNPGGGFPGGLSLNASTGVLSGTPTMSGTFTFTIRATDQNNCTGQRQYTLVINTMPCPTITVSPTNPTLPAGAVGVTYSQTFTQTGGAGTITWSNPGGGLPGGLSLNSSTGVLSGTPTTATTYTFTVRATDANNCTGERQYTLVISGVNPCNPAPIAVGQTVNGALTTSDCLLTANKYVDYYTCTGTVGQQVAIEFTSAAFDTYLILYNPSGTIVAQDDDGGPGTSSRIPPETGYLSLTATGTYKIAATSYLNDSTGSYSITLSEAPMGSTNLQYYSLPYPVRLLDTRAGQLGCDAPGVPIPGGTSRTQLARRTCSGVTIPSTAQVITGNVTTVESNGGYLTLYPSNASLPLVANSNYLANEIVNNAFTVGLGTDGAFKIFVQYTTHVVVDVTGYYAPPNTGGLYFHPLPKPMRLLETRPGEVGCYWYNGQPVPAGVEISQLAHVTCGGVTIPIGTLHQDVA